MVLEVEDSDGGARRALKLMLPTAQQDEVARRFRREFRTLSRLNHPGVLQVHESGMHQGRPWFVMQLLEGRELKDEVESWRELPPPVRSAKARDVLVQLARALAYIHGRGLVHRDVTPSNIMMLPDGRATLMDFGVVKEPGGDLTTVGEVVGTVAYIAPEQISGGPVDFRADLYSLGAVYYLMLTGRRPFNARTLAGYMDKHLHRPVRPPRDLVPTVPADADEVCVRLLQKDPAHRFSSANHLLHVLHAADTVGPAPGRPGWVPPLVGRAAEVAAVRGAVARLAGGDVQEPRGGVLLLTGDAGMGLGRIADEIALFADRLGLSVSRGRNLHRDQDAYEAFREVYEDLVQASGAPPPAVLAATFGDAAAEGERIERYAVMSAMGRLAAAGGQRVVVVESMERADRGSTELAEYLVRNLAMREDAPLLFIFTRNPPDLEDPLEDLISGASTGVAAEEIALGPIPAAAVEELLLGIVEDSAVARVLARRLHEQGQGNPFFVTEMIRGLIEQGAIRIPTDGLLGRVELSARELEDLVLPVPRTLRDIIRKRLAPMSSAARRVALALGTSRVDLDVDLLIEVTGLAEEAVLAALDELIESRLVREERRGERERYELDRNRVADVLLEETPRGEVLRLHRRIGDALEARHPRRTEAVVETLATHYDQGAWPAKAVPYLMQAADKLVQRTFVDEALRMLDRALALEPEARRYLPIDDADRRLTQLRLARANGLVHLGRWTEGWEEAAAAHLLALDLAEPRLLARTHLELAVQARRQLELGAATTHLGEALELADQVGDRRMRTVPLYEAGAVAWIQGDLDAARGYFVQAQETAVALDDERAQVLGANGLGLIALCQGQSAEARRCFSRAIDLAERFGLMDRLSTARANLVEVYHLTGNLRKGLELADRAVAHAREVNHLHGIGTGLRYRVLMLTDMGRITEAISNAEEAIRIQEGLGQADDVLAGLVVLIRAVLLRGETERATELLDEALSLTEDYDSEGFLPVLMAWRARLLADADEFDEARAVVEQISEIPGRRWPHQQVRVNLNLARVYELLGESADARERADEALRTADASGFRFYAMRARQMLARVTEDARLAARHARVGDALARSLAANLAREDAAVFLEAQGVKPRGRVVR